MAENLGMNSGAIEVEIAQLQKLIEEKRNLLEKDSGIIEEKELVKLAVGEFISGSNAAPVIAGQNTDDQTDDQALAVPLKSKITSNNSEPSYLDHLDDNSAAQVNNFIEEISKDGIAKTISKVSIESPFIVDAFHDALVDKLYEELKTRGIVK